MEELGFFLSIHTGSPEWVDHYQNEAQWKGSELKRIHPDKTIIIPYKSDLKLQSRVHHKPYSNSRITGPVEYTYYPPR